MADDENWDADWVFYRDRPEWKDVTPIPQEEGPEPVVKIAYSEKFRDVFDYFRAVLASKEHSERAFKLTEDAISVNASNYTVWNYRRLIIVSMDKDIAEEFDYVSQIIEYHPKNYQAWHHRNALVHYSRDYSREKAFTERILADDPKNYHAWQHRQGVLKEFKLWSGEIEFVDKLLTEDIRNNSAWNHRYYVLSQAKGGFTHSVIYKEVKYTLTKIELAPSNESPWNYLRGVLQDIGLSCQVVTEFTERLFDSGCRSPHLLGFMIDTIEETLLKEKNEALLKKAIQLCMSLSMMYDRIRCEYWRFIAREMNQLYKSPEEKSDSGKGDGATAAKAEPK